MIFQQRVEPRFSSINLVPCDILVAGCHFFIALILSQSDPTCYQLRIYFIPISLLDHSGQTPGSGLFFW